MTAKWRPRLSSATLPYRAWLLRPGSLTRHIQSDCGQFSVQPLRQRPMQPNRDERRLLGLREGERAMVREVLLRCGTVPVVFAHSVLPMEYLRGEWRAFGALGDQSLGAALFADPAIRRAALHFRPLGRQHALYRSASAALDAPPGRLWARRSIFRLREKRILVTEVFLPEILNLGSRCFQCA
ncbi:MAG: chorismate lyase [Betaproteobacteria bacterium]|nr:chorismate lyase [Betaproteobacteria bacterium]